MIYDCFISHQHEDIEYVKSLADALERRGLVCWYAPRNITGRYAKAIAEGISHSRVFLLILNSRSIRSDAVLDEIEMAHNVAKNSPYSQIQPICTETLDYDHPDNQEMMLYIRRLQFLNAENIDNFDELAEKVIESQPQLKKQASKRTKSDYVVQACEDDRLKQQNTLLDLFDLDVYQELFSRYTAPRVLDVGCGTGDMLASKIDESDLGRLIGIDISRRQIDTASAKYPSPKYAYFAADAEAENFEETLESIKRDTEIACFDVINISMILLHLQDPEKLLSIVRRSLSETGTLIIRDIDDGLNFAHPDPENAFERVYKLCYRDEQSGNRHNGRRIYTDLVRAGYSEITLERQGLSSIKMTADQKQLFFNMYFPFTLENARIMMEKYPWNKELREDYLWYRDNFEGIRENFSDPEFIFSLGFMTYTAKR